MKKPETRTYILSSLTSEVLNDPLLLKIVMARLIEKYVAKRGKKDALDGLYAPGNTIFEMGLLAMLEQNVSQQTEHEALQTIFVESVLACLVDKISDDNVGPLTAAYCRLLGQLS